MTRERAADIMLSIRHGLGPVSDVDISGALLVAAEAMENFRSGEDLPTYVDARMRVEIDALKEEARRG